MTEATAADLHGAFALRKLDRVAVKGKKEPIFIYEALGLADHVSDAERKLIEQFEQALEAYFDRRFDEATQGCQEILRVWPEDGPAKNLLERSQTYQLAPPPPDWDGAWVMTKK